MKNKDIFDKITKDFLNYLSSLGISPKSFKNYKSDISHFTGWLIFKAKTWGVLAETLTDTIPFLNQDLASQYKNYLLENKIAVKTVNRRLSTLRHLANFFIVSQILDFNFMEGIANLSSNPSFQKGKYQYLIQGFNDHLASQKASPNTIKNYLSDIKHFVSWLEEKGEAHV
jgi:site-specific recombinase XerD